jgi:hypothetical protein
MACDRGRRWPDVRGVVVRALALAVIALGVSACAGLAQTPPETGATAADGAREIWRPAPRTPWQWQITGTIDESVKAEVFDVDLFDTDEAVVDRLHAKRRRVICYMSAGSFEDWRPDVADFPDAVKGAALGGWPGERWLDIRRLDVLGPIMLRRMDLCRAKGFDAVEPDNIDAYANDSGFPLTAEDQLEYNRFLARAAHARGLSIGLKNDLDQVEELEPDFDWALNESCFAYDECDRLKPFTQAGKAVFHVEYEKAPSEFCGRARALGFSSLRKNWDLDAWRVACPTSKRVSAPRPSRGSGSRSRARSR